MRNFIILTFLSVFLSSCASVDPPELEVHEKAQQDLDQLMDSIFDFTATNRNCLACHQGIMPARSHQSEMMQAISKLGVKYGDPNGCIVCHGGNPMEEKDMKLAHGKSPHGNAQTFFTPTPGALQVNENTCGLCHDDHVYNAHRSIMNTDAGKAKYITWSWGIGLENKDHIYGNYDMKDPDGDIPRFGTEVYKEYMKELAGLHPGQFPKELKQIPEVSFEMLASMPQQAAFTYLRRCNSCHLSNSSGGSRGLGCATCHSLSSKSRSYEGDDPTLKESAKGRVMVHGLLGSRKSKVKVNDKEISGIQVSTCAKCHSSGRRIGTSYQGFAMGKYLKNDAHHRIEKDGKMVTGLLCQDCHTSTSMHGNGNIGSTTLATVEVECADCHGTPKSYPWELALAYGEEFGRDITDRPARGLADRPMPITERFGTVYDKEEGYLLTARGNPFGNVVRTKDGVKIYSATGNEFDVPLLKDITENDTYQNPIEAKTAMVAVAKHMESMECYACHSAWAGQYYGYYNTMKYKSKSADYIASAQFDTLSGTTLENKYKFTYQAGQVSGSYSHSRWETPPLGINGEGRVAPLTAIIQTVGSVVDENGKTLLSQSAPKRASGEHAMEMSPLHPHTNSLKARKCQDCHGSDLAMGYGSDGGKFQTDPSVARYDDIVDADGENISKYTRPQIAAIASLKGAFDQILDRDGKQRLTVGSHWEGSGPLTKEQLHKLSRSGTCAACHQDVPMGSIPISMLKQIAKVADLSFTSAESHNTLLMQNNILMAWIKVIGIILAIPLLIAGAWYFFYKRRH